MAQQKINLGTQGNDGTGDAIRVAFSKVNDNFGELYGNTTGLIDVANDTTPQLGGDLDINSKNIISVSNTSINILPNGTGSVILDKVKITDSAITSNLANTNLALAGNGTGTVTIHGLRYPTVDGAASQVLQTNGSGSLSWVNNAGGGGGSTGLLSIINSTIYGPSNSDVSIEPNGTGHVVLDQVKIRDNTISTTSSNSPLELTANGAGKVSISGMLFPNADGSAGHYLKTDGAGTLSFASIPASQNLWATVSSDSGNATANTTTDTLTVTGNSGITTAISGDTLTITGPNTDAVAEGSTNLYYTDARFDTRLASKSTANLTEGSNLYYTNARADARIVAASINALSDVDTSGVANGSVLKYNSGTSNWEVGADVSGGSGADNFLALTDTPSNFTSSAGKYLKVTSGANAIEFDTLTTADVTEGANLYYTDARFDTRLAAKTTADLTEGANLYYTDARADARVGLANVSDLANVHTTAPTDGQVLTWDNGNSRWAPSTVSVGSATSLTTDGLTIADADILGTKSDQDINMTNQTETDDETMQSDFPSRPSG